MLLARRVREARGGGRGGGRGWSPDETCILSCFSFLSLIRELLPQVAQGNVRQGLLRLHLNVEGR